MAAEVHLQLQYCSHVAREIELARAATLRAARQLSFVHKGDYVLTSGFVCPRSLFFNLDDAMYVTLRTRLPRFSHAKLLMIIKKWGGAWGRGYTHKLYLYI